MDRCISCDAGTRSSTRRVDAGAGRPGVEVLTGLGKTTLCIKKGYDAV